MDCRTCAYSDWDYPSTECATCRGYRNHVTELPLPGMCIGEVPVDDIDPLYMDVLKALDTITALNKVLIYGTGTESTRAKNMLTMVSNELKTLRMEGE